MTMTTSLPRRRDAPIPHSEVNRVAAHLVAVVGISFVRLKRAMCVESALVQTQIGKLWHSENKYLD